ncbi:MAG: hypothetical protein H6586_09110 [Flavobacteriales bacterium]|nr:hypothetical protein [Flavobacteriales bacterium]
MSELEEWIQKLAFFLPQVDGNNDLKQSGYFTLAEIDGVVNRIFKIGQPPAEKVKRFLTLSQEKVERLSLHIVSDKHVSSYQSRNPDKGQWGGAIVASDYENQLILSFSGLPEKLDEALCLVVAGKMKLSFDKQILELSQNPFYEQVKKIAEKMDQK